MNLLGTDGFLYFTVALFVFQAGLIATISRFSLPFDESFHMGVIQLHAQQWSPFFTSLPESANRYGALLTDSSYLYHYLMSFPYRVINLFTDSVFAIVVFMRVVNIALFACGLLFFKKALSNLGTTNALNNFVIFVFAGLPLMTFIAANINYDNMIFLLVGAGFMFSTKIIQDLRSRSEPDVKSFVWLLVVCATMAQVKYTMLAFAAPLFILTLTGAFCYALRNKKAFKTKLRLEIKSLRSRYFYLLIVLALTIFSLGAFRFGYNISKYHALSPGCERVMSRQACEKTPIYTRDQAVKEAHLPIPTRKQKVLFAKSWLQLMKDEQFEIISTYNGGNFLPAVKQLVFVGTIFIIGGLILLIVKFRKIIKTYPLLWLYLSMALIYSLTLFHKNYSDFATLGKPMALQGRYLLPIMLPVVLLLATAYWVALEKLTKVKFMLLAVLLIVGLQGGGAITYFLRVDAQWYWSKGARLPYKPGENIR